MFINLAKLVRALVIALALCTLNSSTAEAKVRSKLEASPTVDPYARVERDVPAGDPAAGMALIVGAVGLFIFLAWIAVRIGDSDRPADKVPN